MSAGRASRQRGYTLIEVIAAFAVLALGLSLLLGTLSGGVRQVRESADAGRAALYAQSLLASLGVDTPLQPGRSSGEFEQGGYRWELEITPYRDPVFAGSELDGGAELLELNLSFTWREGGTRERWRLRTLRLAVRS